MIVGDCICLGLVIVGTRILPGMWDGMIVGVMVFPRLMIVGWSGVPGLRMVIPPLSRDDCHRQNMTFVI